MHQIPEPSPQKKLAGADFAKIAGVKTAIGQALISDRPIGLTDCGAAHLKTTVRCDGHAHVSHRRACAGRIGARHCRAVERDSSALARSVKVVHLDSSAEK